MRKTLAGFVVALVVGIPAIYFGVPWWAEQKALRQLDTTLDSVRRSGGTASRGAARFDLWTRTLKISDLSLQSGDPAKGSVKIGQVTAKGIASRDPSRFSADSLELADAEITGLQLGPASPVQIYTIPELTAEHLSGPTEFTPKQSAVAGADDALTALTTFAALSATRVTIPSMKVTGALRAENGTSTNTSVNYDITDAVLDTVEAGRIKSASVAHTATRVRLPDNSMLTADIEKIAVSEADLNPLITALDPAQPKDDKFFRIYRQFVTGRYSAKLAGNGALQLDSILIDDFAIQPGKVLDPALLTFANTLQTRTNTPATPTEMAEILNNFAAIYEGLKVGKLEARGFTSDIGTKTPAKIGLMQITGLEAGKIAELAVENVAINPPAEDTVTLGRFAFKAIDFVKLMRLLSQFATNPSLTYEQRLAFLSILGGVELKDFKGAERATGQPLRIETADLSWGQYIGAIPSQIHAKTKFTAVIDPQGNDPNLRYLVDSGIKDVTVDVDLAAAWNETARTIALSPLTATFSKVVGLSAAGSLANVPAAIFSSNPMMSGIAAIQVEAGPLNITLHDLGITDLIAAQLARDQGTTLEAMRTRLVEMIRVVAITSPELETLGTALAHLIEARATTLNIMLTPKTHISILQAVDLARANPLLLLSQFNVEAKTDR